MENKISLEKIKKYISISKEALEKALKSECEGCGEERKDFVEMIKCYISDAEHFLEKEDLVNAFAAINYAHGWLDAGARIGLFKVKDSKLFTVDD